MAWVESQSASFRARHESDEADDAARVLDSLEHTRAHLDELFPRTVGEVAIVLHRSPALLALTHPLLPAAQLLTAPAMRRYVVGWTGPSEIHVLSPDALRSRAANVDGSREMLARAPDVLYARLVVGANNRRLPPPFTPRRIANRVRWAWLIDGAARYFGGQTEHARTAIARRLRESGRPSFPPAPSDAALLGGTVFDFVVHERGTGPAVAMALKLHPDGPRAAIAEALGAGSQVAIEGAWRSHLSRLASV
jgi:hypothetical protein